MIDEKQSKLWLMSRFNSKPNASLKLFQLTAIEFVLSPGAIVPLVAQFAPRDARVVRAGELVRFALGDF